MGKRSRAESGMTRWPLWVAGINSTFETVTKLVSAPSEAAVPHNLVAGLDEARGIVDSFLRNPSGIPLIDPSHGMRTVRLHVPRLRDTSLFNEPVAYEQSTVSAVLDPEGPLLPQDPREARTQVKVSLSDFDDKAEHDIRGRMIQLRAGIEDLQLSGRSAANIYERGVRMRDAYRSLAEVSVSGLDARVQRSYFEWGPGVITDPLLTLRFLVRSTGTVNVVAERNVGGLPLRTDVPLDTIAGFPPKTKESADQLHQLFEAAYSVIHESAEGGRRPR